MVFVLELSRSHQSLDLTWSINISMCNRICNLNLLSTMQQPGITRGFAQQVHLLIFDIGCYHHTLSDSAIMIISTLH